MKRFTRWLAGIIFLSSAVLKLFNPGPFIRLLYKLNFSHFLMHVTLIVFVLTESVLAVMLLFNRRKAMELALAYLSSLTGALVILWLSGIDADCGCFGGFIRTQIGPIKIIQNGALLVMLYMTSNWNRHSQKALDRSNP